jgi:uncharacterized protein
MELEWDEEKRNDALKRHGVDFADVALIDFQAAHTAADNRRDYGETRFITYGTIEDRLHVVCWVRRDGKMRVISFRKANDREKRLLSPNA